MKTNYFKLSTLLSLTFLLFSGLLQAQNQPLFNTGNGQNKWQKELVFGVGFQPIPTDSAESAAELGLVTGLRLSPQRNFNFNWWNGAMARFEAEVLLSIPFNTNASVSMSSGFRGLIGTKTFSVGPEIRGYLSRIVVSGDTTQPAVALPDIQRTTVASLYLGGSIDLYVVRILRSIDLHFQGGMGRQINANGGRWKGYGGLVFTGYF